MGAEMILRCLDVIDQDPWSQSRDPEERFIGWMDWASMELGIESYLVTPGFQMETRDQLQELFRPDELRQAGRWDWIGEAALTYGVIDGLESEDTIRWMVQTYKDTVSGSSSLVFDPNVSTGRMILALSEHMPMGTLFYGAAQDLLEYRIALLNMRVFNISAFLLLADPKLHDLDPGSQNWLVSNLWFPLPSGHLYRLPSISET